MAIHQTNFSRDPIILQISPYLEAIIDKKVNNIALGCFEMLVHWFLTTFSCFYPAYSDFYESRKISDHGIKDIALIEFYTGFKDQIRREIFPLQNGNTTQDAKAIRTWMEENRNLFDHITEVNVADTKTIFHLPEIGMFSHLRIIRIKNYISHPEEVSPSMFQPWDDTPIFNRGPDQ